MPWRICWMCWRQIRLDDLPWPIWPWSARSPTRDCAFLVPDHFGMLDVNTLNPGLIDAVSDGVRRQILRLRVGETLWIKT